VRGRAIVLGLARQFQHARRVSRFADFMGRSAVATDRSARDRALRSFRLRIGGRTRERAPIQELAAKEAAITPIAIMQSA